MYTYAKCIFYLEVDYVVLKLHTKLPSTAADVKLLKGRDFRVPGLPSFSVRNLIFVFLPRDGWISTNDESVDFGVAIPQTAAYGCKGSRPPEVELSNCFCGHCSAISIERFRRKVSFSGIAGVSEWMARRPTVPFTIQRSSASCVGPRGIPRS